MNDLCYACMRTEGVNEAITTSPAACGGTNAQCLAHCQTICRSGACDTTNGCECTTCPAQSTTCPDQGTCNNFCTGINCRGGICTSANLCNCIFCVIPSSG
uniref:Uncharacterized protein n=1 Tax=Acrobeloides nanus TaxID=290746 RepID=A0A914C7D4_9BILA